MKRVTIVEDDPAVRDALQIICTRAGYEVTAHANGNAILNGRFEHPHIFILDKQLSGVDGLDVCRFLKTQPDTSAIPVIIISATPHVARSAKEACADDFLEKPFKNSELLAMIAKHIA